MSKHYFAHESAYIDEPVTIGRDTKIWHFCHIMSNAVIGEGCVIGQNVFIAGGVKIGNNVRIQNNVSIYEGVELEDDVFCGPSMVFTNVTNPRSHVSRKDDFRPTLVRQGATIGANATIVCGSNLGAHAFVAAGAVITHDVPAYALMMGVPARQHGWACACGVTLRGDTGWAGLGCPECGARYESSGEGIVPVAKNEDL